MWRHILGAISIFALITGLAIWVANREEPAPLSAPAAPATPPAEMTLEPSGDFLPRATLPHLRLRASPLADAQVRFYRLRQRALAFRLYRGVMQGSLSPIAAARLIAETTPPLTQRSVTLHNGAAELDWPAQAQEPGLYLVTAAATSQGNAQAASWFLRSDLHLMAVNDDAGWHALCQNLARPSGPVRLTWFGFEVTPLKTGESCAAPDTVPAASLPPDAPLHWLFGEDQQGNFGFVALRTLRQSGDKAQPGLLTTDRAHYLPGQTIMALVRGADFADPQTTLALEQPNGLRVREIAVPESRVHLAWIDIALPLQAPPGTWRLLALRQGREIKSLTLQVGESPLLSTAVFACSRNATAP